MQSVYDFILFINNYTYAFATEWDKEDHVLKHLFDILSWIQILLWGFGDSHLKNECLVANLSLLTCI